VLSRRQYRFEEDFMRLMLAIAVAASMIAFPCSAQNPAPVPEPQPKSSATAKSEDDLSGKTPPKDERGGKEKQQQGHESGWTGHGKTPEETKAEPGRNEVEGQEMKKP
jgi:hypothetical protein